MNLEEAILEVSKLCEDREKVFNKALTWSMMPIKGSITEEQEKAGLYTKVVYEKSD